MFDPPDPEGQKNPLISACKGVLSGAQAGANIGKFLLVDVEDSASASCNPI